jgi:Cu+-exporting ATPase
VIKSQLNFGKKELSVWFKESELSIGELASLLSKIGYEPLIHQGDELEEQKKTFLSDKKLVLKLGVAGFCMGNIMLFSFPEYLGLEDAGLEKWFGFLNLFLGSISVFYTGSDYFSNVWAHLKLKKITIEAPVLLGIVVGYSRSVYEIIFHQGAGYMDSVSGLLFFLLIGKWFQQKSFDFLSFNRNYTSYFPLTINKIQGGKEIQIPLSEIKLGDRILIRNQEIIPADAILIKGNCKIDYSFVTGESDIIEINARNTIYAGGRQTGELIEIEVIKDLQHSHLTQLWEQDTFKDPLFKTENWENFANTTGKYFTIGLFALAVGVGAYWGFNNPLIWQNAVISVLIIACPCALAISYPFSLGHTMRWMSIFNFYFKNIQALERFSEIDTLVFDKTGTLTLQKDQSPSIQFTRGLSENEWNQLYTLSLQSSHPLSRQLNKYAIELGFQEVLPIKEFEEIPGKGIQGIFNDSLIQLGSRKYVNAPMTEPNNYYQSESRLYVKIQDEYIGYLDFPWQNRKGIEPMLHQLYQDYDLYLLSGDKKQHAYSLVDWFHKDENMLFEMSPMDKMKFIKKLQAKGKKVGMIGDGLNDAGALKEASIGIAISENHLQFTPASDGILQANQLNNLGYYLHFSKFAMKVIKLSFLLSLVYNIIGLSYAVQGHLSPMVAAILMPINSLSMLLIATISINWKGKKLEKLVNVSKSKDKN